MLFTLIIPNNSREAQQILAELEINTEISTSTDSAKWFSKPGYFIGIPNAIPTDLTYPGSADLQVAQDNYSSLNSLLLGKLFYQVMEEFIASILPTMWPNDGSSPPLYDYPLSIHAQLQLTSDYPWQRVDRSAALSQIGELLSGIMNFDPTECIVEYVYNSKFNHYA